MYSNELLHARPSLCRTIDQPTTEVGTTAQQLKQLKYMHLYTSCVCSQYSMCVLPAGQHRINPDTETDTDLLGREKVALH